MENNKPQTIGDCIRNMTDEELAEYISKNVETANSWEDSFELEMLVELDISYEKHGDIKETIYSWLRQPVEGE